MSKNSELKFSGFRVHQNCLGGGGLIVQSCPALCDPMNCSLPGSSVQSSLQQEYSSGLPFPSPGDLPDPGTEPGSPALRADSSPTELPGKPHRTC